MFKFVELPKMKKDIVVTHFADVKGALRIYYSPKFEVGELISIANNFGKASEWDNNSIILHVVPLFDFQEVIQFFDSFNMENN